MVCDRACPGARGRHRVTRGNGRNDQRGNRGLGWWGRTLVEAVSNGQSDEINFVAGAARTHTDDLKAFAKQQKFELYDSYEKLLKDPKRSTRSCSRRRTRCTSSRSSQAAESKKHVFCEKPFALTRAGAERAVNAVKKAGVTLGLGYNRRWHPEMTKLRNQIDSGELGVVLHVEATMTFPNALQLKADAWRANKHETPCGGLTPMGVTPSTA